MGGKRRAKRHLPNRAKRPHPKRAQRLLIKSRRDVGNEPVYDANGLDWVRQTAQSQIVGVESIAENFVGERQSRVKHRRSLMGQTRLNIGKRD
jgi:hypothetical protein